MPPPPHPDVAQAEPATPFGPAQREVLGLLLTFGAIAYVLQTAATAYSLSGGGQLDVSVYGGIESETDWVEVLRTTAYAANLQVVLFLVGGLVLASGRSYHHLSRAGRLTLSALFPMGIAFALAATYNAIWILALQDDGGDEFGSSVRFSATTGGAFGKLGTASLFVVTAAIAIYVAWCAFQQLPMANPASDEPEPEPEPLRGPNWSDAVGDAEEA